MFKLLVVGALALSLVGCSTTHVIDHPGPQAAGAKLVPGERVKLLLKSHARLDLKVESVASTSFSGRDTDGKSKQIQFDQIEQLETREFSGWRTAGLALGIATAVLVGGAIAAGNAIEDGIDDSFKTAPK